LSQNNQWQQSPRNLPKTNPEEYVETEPEEPIESETEEVMADILDSLRQERYHEFGDRR